MDKDLHKKVMSDFLIQLNKNTNDYVLKGGTALYFCYELDRFSTDIDLDSNRDLNTFIENFCKKNNFTYFNKKNTDTVNRYSIHYNIEALGDMLKIEISHRRYNTNKSNIVKINGILTYDINTLFAMKLSAGLNRSKIRDLYDICFIYNNYKNQINDANILILENFLNEKGKDYFEYLIKEQGSDEIIDIEKFEDNYLKMLYSFENENVEKENLTD